MSLVVHFFGGMPSDDSDPPHGVHMVLGLSAYEAKLLMEIPTFREFSENTDKFVARMFILQCRWMTKVKGRIPLATPTRQEWRGMMLMERDGELNLKLFSHYSLDQKKSIKPPKRKRK
jgi:hypothetical protein